MGTSGHAEAINVIFDPSIVSYDELVDKHMATHDPTQKNRQGNDVGTQYRSGIYVYNDEQKKVAEAKCAAIKGCVTEILPATTFHPAEDYHQQYLSRGGRFGMAQVVIFFGMISDCSLPYICCTKPLSVYKSVSKYNSLRQKVAPTQYDVMDDRVEVLFLYRNFVLIRLLSSHHGFTYIN